MARQRPLVLSPSQPSGSQDDLWLRRRRRRHTKWQQQLIRWRGEEESEDEGEALILDWASESLSSQEQLSPELLGSEELATQVGAGTGLRQEGRVGKAGPAAAAPLPLRAFSSRPRGAPARLTSGPRPTSAASATDTGAHSGKKATSICPGSCNFSSSRAGSESCSPSSPSRFAESRTHGKHGLGSRAEGDWGAPGQGLSAPPLQTYPEMYPEMLTVEGLASLLMGQLEKVSWMDRVHILRALMRLLPDMSKDLCDLLHSLLLRLLNLDPPPGLQVCP